MADWRRDDRELLARILVAEAGNQGPVGMTAAGNVIMNRANLPGYGDGVRGVIMKPGQFSPMNSVTGYAGGEQGQNIDAISPSETAYMVADSLLSGTAGDITGGATHFYNPEISNPSWAQGVGSTRIGDHVFLQADAGRSTTQNRGATAMRQPTMTQGQPAPAMQGQTAPMPQEQQPGFLRGLLSDPDFFDRLAIGFGGLTLNPNQALMQMSADRIAGRAQTRQDTAATNRTVEYLRSQGRDDLADAVASGSLGARDAAAILFQEPKTQDPYSSVGKLQADLAAGRISQDQYEVAIQGMAQQGFSIRTNPDGSVEMVQGAGGLPKALTEGQSKDATYATRAEGSLPVLDQYDVALANVGDRALDVDPTGVVRGRMQSTEYQLAKQAGDEFLQAILRKDTGAAITVGEQQLYGVTYLPQPGDSPELIAQKRQARRRALEALKAGMPPSAIVAQERALEQSGSGAATPTPPDTAQMSDDELLEVYGG
jgi:hypothetical protein